MNKLEVIGIDLYNQTTTGGVAKTLSNKATDADHIPCVLVFDARGNGGGGVCPTITGDHQDRVTDYTAIVVQSASPKFGSSSGKKQTQA